MPKDAQEKPQTPSNSNQNSREALFKAVREKCHNKLKDPEVLAVYQRLAQK
ncbi:hypothetical protein [Helicobacter bizzozeronii]|uniref:Uncharacterized protein n=1 Tax=Helicobacter bizzozeronii (strain CIII-1) TaxID=1002804 RepID=F8KUJ5_HELBC|nr:hypothetical protein [Helicobacter bizzozeronii]CCB80930.1 hypothetical protein HBZC1_p0500 [Helicobacter bizzozeronii CIII-1]